MGGTCSTYEDMISTQITLVGREETTRLRLEDNIKMDGGEIWWDGMDWSY